MKGTASTVTVVYSQLWHTEKLRKHDQYIDNKCLACPRWRFGLLKYRITYMTAIFVKRLFIVWDEFLFLSKSGEGVVYVQFSSWCQLQSAVSSCGARNVHVVLVVRCFRMRLCGLVSPWIVWSCSLLKRHLAVCKNMHALKFVFGDYFFIFKYSLFDLNKAVLKAFS